jgi:hypothetical protein
MLTIRMNGLSPKPVGTVRIWGEQTVSILTSFTENGELALFPSGLVNVSLGRHLG